jgi:hypothetical protein
VSGIVLEMGSVTRNCYYTTTNSSAITSVYSGMTYDFANDILLNSLSAGASTDFIIRYTSCNGCNAPGNYFYFQNSNANGLPVSTISYLGKGNLVDYDFVPPSSTFYADSTVAKGGPNPIFEAGDIYCLGLSSIPGGHAWIQITNPGDINTSAYGPSFIFRTNSSVPYFAYDRTLADLANTCSTTY